MTLQRISGLAPGFNGATRTRGPSAHNRVALVVVAAMLATFAATVPTPATVPRASAATSTRVFGAIADARVERARPNMNFGASALLWTDASPAVESYLRFYVSGVVGVVQSARLRVFVYDPSRDGPAVYATATNWSETGITWNNRAPRTSGALADKSFVGPNTWVDYPVTARVRGNGLYSFSLASASGDGVGMSSRQAARLRPMLIVTFAYTMPSLTYPIRAMFYYPWFPNAWKQGGIYPYTRYHPSLGYYDSGDATLISRHIRSMQYAKIRAGIASWWGQGSRTDWRIPALLRGAQGTGFKWTLYHEQESQGDPSVAQIRSDLTYIRDRYSTNPNYLWINGRFVVFVYASPSDGCAMAARWRQANTVGAYVVLKVFQGYRYCPYRPDSWHQYSPSKAADHQAGYSYAISPGFWHVREPYPRLARNLLRWKQNVRYMVASRSPWQLITTFNEWGEGTATESAREWATASGQGAYLDALHWDGTR
jgi:hypothetical protein